MSGGNPFRHPRLERRSRGLRGTHEHSHFTVIMGDPNKSGHDGLGRLASDRYAIPRSQAAA